MSETSDKSQSNPAETIIPDGLLTPTPDHKDEIIAELQKKATETSKRQNEERLAWILGLLFVFDAYLFERQNTWTGPLVIGVLQLLLIFILANNFGIESVAPFFDKVIGAFMRERDR